MPESPITTFLAAGGGGAAVAFALFRWLGTKWLETRFEERLELYRRKQSEELERTKAQVNLMLDRVTKIHEKEFEVLPQAWQLLQLAIGHSAALVSPFYDRPDLDRFTADELEQYLSASKFLETDRQRLRDATSKAAVYRELDFWYRLRDAKRASSELHNYLLLNRLFLSADVYAPFRECDTLISSSLGALELAEAANAPEVRRNVVEEFASKDALVAKIESAIQNRLRFHLASDTSLSKAPGA